ncbi:MAG: hypothetical protein II299_00945 [Alistipes sp.]|nr:hypothetical protein [Alistipes sp.]
MGSFWWIFLIMGVFAFLKRKEGVPEEGTSAPQAPSDEEKQDIDRRIREILGEPQPAKRVVPTYPKTSPKMTPQPQRSYAPRATVQSGASKPDTTTMTSGTNRVVASPKKSGATTSQSVPTKTEQESVVDDFSLEKAVIYAEILEPKYKEY